MKLPKYVYKVDGRNRWVVKKCIKGKTHYFKSFDNPTDAIKYTKYMESVGWVDEDALKELEYQREQKQYFIRVSLDGTRKKYRVRHYEYGELDTVEGLCEALYYRDLYSTSKLPFEEIPSACDCDLVTNNPYIINGLDYEVPKRLYPSKKVSKRGKGKIVKKSKSSYSIYCGHKHYCSCRTYEQAYFVRRELVKVNWNENELERIFEEYPRFYTELLYFYIYISKDSYNNEYWLLTIPKDKSDDGKLQHIRYSRLEDALFERDFLVDNGWDYDLLVELIDDNLNPYYDMELPPYPERKIRNITHRESHDDDFLKMAELIRENPKIRVKDLAEKIGIVPATLRNWFKQYGTNSSEFYSVCLEGGNPLDYFEQEELIYTPDLSKSTPSHYKGYVHYAPKRNMKYIVNYKDVYYGCYPTRELADKVVKELVKVDWDKSKLKSIQKMFNYNSRYTNEMIYIYKNNRSRNSYQIRKKINGVNKSFGSYQGVELAMIVRDILVGIDFECEDLTKLKRFSEYVLEFKNSFYSNMFGGVRL